MNTTSTADIPPKAGRYLLASRLGDGQFGPIYRAIDLDSGQTAAVQFPGKGRRWDAAELRAVLEDCGELLKLRHQSVVALLEAGVEEGTLYLVSEFASGVSLSTALQAGPTLTVEKKLSILIQCSEALAIAHGRGFVHGSFSPSKVSLTPDGSACVRQIGFCRLLSRYASRPRWSTAR